MGLDEALDEGVEVEQEELEKEERVSIRSLFTRYVSIERINIHSS